MTTSDPQSYSIIRAAMQVHRQLGLGFLASVYQDALAIEYTERGVLFQCEGEIPVFYKGRILQVVFRADSLCFGTLIFELKALAMLSGAEEARVQNDLKATGLRSRAIAQLRQPVTPTKRFIRHGKWDLRELGLRDLKGG